MCSIFCKSGSYRQYTGNVNLGFQKPVHNSHNAHFFTLFNLPNGGRGSLAEEKYQRSRYI